MGNVCIAAIYRSAGDRGTSRKDGWSLAKTSAPQNDSNSATDAGELRLAGRAGRIQRSHRARGCSHCVAALKETGRKSRGGGSLSLPRESRTALFACEKSSSAQESASCETELNGPFHLARSKQMPHLFAFCLQVFFGVRAGSNFARHALGNMHARLLQSFNLIGIVR